MAKIEVIMSTTREGRFSEGVAEWVVNYLKTRGDLDVSLLDLRDYELPFFDSPSPAMNPRQYTNPAAEAFGKRIDEADGFVILTAEYNRGYSAVLKNAIDHTWAEWNRKPVAFVGWGNTGGARAIEHLQGVADRRLPAPRLGLRGHAGDPHRALPSLPGGVARRTTPRTCTTAGASRRLTPHDAVLQCPLSGARRNRWGRARRER